MNNEQLKNYVDSKIELLYDFEILIHDRYKHDPLHKETKNWLMSLGTEMEIDHWMHSILTGKVALTDAMKN